MIGLDNLPSPKLSYRDRTNTLYPYYAGFSPAFVQFILDSKAFNNVDLILDPWNGSGTTTLLACQNNIQSYGFEVNPALVVVAKARTTPPQEAQEVANRFHKRLQNRSTTQDTIRELANIYQSVVSEDSKCSERISHAGAAFAAVIVFSYLRGVLKSYRTKNPTWFRLSDIDDLNDGVAESKLISKVEDLCRFQTKIDVKQPERANILELDFTRSALPNISASGVITSPPYLTRIDYVKATLPELLLMNAMGAGANIEELRRIMLGTPLSKSQAIHTDWCGYPKTQHALKTVMEHQSKASASYYFRFFAQYFTGLMQSMHRMAGLVSETAPVVLVCQPSYYKEHLINLPDILVELGEKAGFRLHELKGFRQKNSFVKLNTRAEASSRLDDAEEVVLIFSKG